MHRQLDLSVMCVNVGRIGAAYRHASDFASPMSVSSGVGAARPKGADKHRDETLVEFVDNSAATLEARVSAGARQIVADLATLSVVILASGWSYGLLEPDRSGPRTGHHRRCSRSVGGGGGPHP